MLGTADAEFTCKSENSMRQNDSWLIIKLKLCCVRNGHPIMEARCELDRGRKLRSKNRLEDEEIESLVKINLWTSTSFPCCFQSIVIREDYWSAETFNDVTVCIKYKYYELQSMSNSSTHCTLISEALTCSIRRSLLNRFIIVQNDSPVTCNLYLFGSETTEGLHCFLKN